MYIDAAHAVSVIEQSDFAQVEINSNSGKPSIKEIEKLSLRLLIKPKQIPRVMMGKVLTDKNSGQFVCRGLVSGIHSPEEHGCDNHPDVEATISWLIYWLPT